MLLFQIRCNHSHRQPFALADYQNKLKILKTRQIGREIIIRSWRAATKVVVTWILAVLKTYSTVSYFSLNFGFCLELQTIPDFKKMSWIYSRRFHRWNPFLENLQEHAYIQQVISYYFTEINIVKWHIFLKGPKKRFSSASLLEFLLSFCQILFMLVTDLISYFKFVKFNCSDHTLSFFIRIRFARIPRLKKTKK